MMVRRGRPRWSLTEAPERPLEASEWTELVLSYYLRLTAVQRSCVILKDVMRCSLAEISEVLDLSVPAIKGALHRGRFALREGADGVGEGQPARLDAEEARRLAAYVDRFNARDFDALRNLLVDDARLELVGRSHVRGARSVGSYFANYERLEGWRMEVGLVDGRLAVLGFDSPADAGAAAAPPRPTFFILIQWRRDAIASIRDFRYARHVIDLAHVEVGGSASRSRQGTAAPHMVARPP